MNSRADSSRPRPTLARVLGAAACFGVIVGSAASARAEDSSFCRKVRARAASDAALLYGPTVLAQGIKFPASGATDLGVTTGAGYQFRAAVSFSPLDFYKGFRVERLGEADCKVHETVVSAQEVLKLGSDYGRLPALRKQLAFMDAQQPKLQAIAGKTRERIAAHAGTLREATEIRARIAALGRARAHVLGDAERLEARGVQAYQGPLSVLVDAADRQALDLEREASHVRSLSSWTVGVTAGVIPQDRPVDYFGMVQVGFNFGAFSRNANETKYLGARADELKSARYELRDQVRAFRADVETALAEARRDIVIADEQAAALTEDIATLGRADAKDAPHALAMLELDLLGIEAERVFLNALTEELVRFQENDNGKR